MKKAVLYLIIGIFALNSTINVHAFERSREKQQEETRTLNKNEQYGLNLALFIGLGIIVLLLTELHALSKKTQTPAIVQKEKNIALQLTWYQWFLKKIGYKSGAPL